MIQSESWSTGSPFEPEYASVVLESTSLSTALLSFSTPPSTSSDGLSSLVSRAAPISSSAVTARTNESWTLRAMTLRGKLPMIACRHASLPSSRRWWYLCKGHSMHGSRTQRRQRMRNNVGTAPSDRSRGWEGTIVSVYRIAKQIHLAPNLGADIQFSQAES